MHTRGDFRMATPQARRLLRKQLIKVREQQEASGSKVPFLCIYELLLFLRSLWRSDSECNSRMYCPKG